MPTIPVGCHRDNLEAGRELYRLLNPPSPEARQAIADYVAAAVREEREACAKLAESVPSIATSIRERNP